MKVLFLVDGAAGTGKSDLVSYMANTFRYTAGKVDKYTTRKKRKSEEAKKSDLIFLTNEEFKSLEMRKDDVFLNMTTAVISMAFLNQSLMKQFQKMIAHF